MRPRRLFLLALLILLIPLLRVPTRDRPAPPPAPTEHLLSEDAEERNREGRERWLEEMHRAGPGVDWRAIERENGLARMEQRRRAIDERDASLRAAGGTWYQVGSRNLAGRMHAVALSSDGDSLYGGASLGGVWKADRTGSGWRPLSDQLYGGAHGLAVAAGPPETVTRITDGGLIHYTSDGGLTWLSPSGALSGVTEAKRVLADASDPDRVYLLVKKTFGWRLYRSDDRGQSYVRIGGAPVDVWIDRAAGGTLWVAESGTFQRSDDQGATWTTVGTLPAATDVILTGSEAGAPTFYAALRIGSAWELYRSTDAGVTWTWRHTIQDFWETMAASITNPDLVLYGGVELWRSTDGAASFAKVNNWADYYGDPVNRLHADLPGLDAVWTDAGQELFYIATDGGLYRSDDGVATVTNISLDSLGVSQYYTTLTSANDPDLILAGAQDQGYQRSVGPAVGTWRDFDQLISGDYGHLTSSDGTHARVYCVYPGFILQQLNETSPALTQHDFPPGETYSWMPYILADPVKPREAFFCATHLVRYRFGAFGDVLTPSAQDFTVAGGSYLTAVAISSVDLDDRITVTDTGVIWYSADAGSTWAVSPDGVSSAHYFYGTALEFSPTVAGEAYAGGSGYSGPAVYRTTDGGVSWTALSSGLPSTLVYDLAYEGGASGVVYAATEAGPYRLDPATGTWESLDDPDVPLTLFWCVESVPAAGVMRFGTYARGIWDWQIEGATDAPEVTTAAAEAGARLRNEPNPFTGSTVLRFAVRRAGDVRLRVFDAAGRRVRDLESGYRGAGSYEVSWDGRNDDGRLAAAGVYVARLETADGVAIRRITRLR